MFKEIRKRDGRIVKFDASKITNAIAKAGMATGEFGRDIAERLTLKVLSLAEEIIKSEIPTVEEIQDVVEEVLIDSPYRKTAKAYILYRDQHAKIREISAKANVDLVDQYLEKIDWQVQENSNMTFSLQGLNNYISSEISKVYWLNKIYPPEIRNAHINGDFHIHDLNSLSVYCVGWDLQDLLIEGFRGVPGKAESKPAKHFRSALGQIVNFFYTLQGEAAGAQAFSNFDTLLAPFIRFDNLSYREVKQALQEFIFNTNVSTRTGFQCLSEDTEILTPEGWKNYTQVKEGDEVYTFNIENGTIEKKKVRHVFAREYEGIMYNLRSRSQNQLISPNHRVVRQVFNTDKYKLEPIEEILKFSSPISIPVRGENGNPEAPIEDWQIELLAWILSEGSIEKDGSRRISLYQSKDAHPENYDEIINLLDSHDLDYTVRAQSGLGTCTHIRLKSRSSKVVLDSLGLSSKKEIPSILFQLSKRQARLFLDTYIKGDGWEEGYRRRITVTDKEILDTLTAVAVLAGYNFNVKERIVGGISKKTQYIITLSETQYDFIQKIEAINYKGIIWSVNTENETVIARRDGQVFITGNTPFTNVTLDLTVPQFMKDQPVIIGGKPQSATYGEFQEEVDIFNKAFLEVMLEGDAKGRVFTFPIPTYSITKDFDWDNPNIELLWEVTAKYGIPYFSNFINSDMKPEDVRSMCLHPNESIVVKINDQIVKTTIGELSKNYAKQFDNEGWAETDANISVLSFNPNTYKVEWRRIVRFFRTYDDCLVTIETYDGRVMRVSKEHPVAVYTPRGITFKPAIDIDKNDILIVLKNAQDVLKIEDIYIGNYKLDEDLAFFMGLFIADGNYLYDDREQCNSYGKERGIQITFNTEDIELIERVKDIAYTKFNYKIKFKKDPRYKHSLYGYIYNAELARVLSENGFKKYDGVPNFIFNSKKEVIISFLEGIFAGNGYQRGKEIHINNKRLAEDLVLLYSLVGIPTTIKFRKNSQVIRLQHVSGRGSKDNNIVVDILYNRVPQYIVKTAKDKPFYDKEAMVCKSSLDKHDAHTEESIKILSSSMALVKIRSIKTENLPCQQEFYDIELEENHYFVHSLGNITHNCCRLRLNNRDLQKRGGGLFGANPLTGSIGVVTINMPRLGYLSKDEEEFFERLERLMILAKESLEIKRKVLERFTERDLYPYSKFYLREVKNRFGEYWKNHFSTIGLIGMNEACLNLLGVDIGTEEGREFAIKVLSFMREKLIEFQEETGNIYNLEATPGEGTSYRLARIDKDKYPEIICANEIEFRELSAEPFYTNSTQLPVNYTDDIFYALELQDEIQTMYTGGTVLHIFVGERIQDPSSVKYLIKKICENYRLPYITITPTFSVCPSHGYISGECPVCPRCGEETEIYSRVVGYLRPVKQWNKGKQEEFKLRKTFSIR